MKSPIVILHGFDRAYLAGDGSVKKEVIHCRLIFTYEEAEAFVAKQREGRPPLPDGMETSKKTKWSDYCTAKMDFSK